MAGILTRSAEQIRDEWLQDLLPPGNISNTPDSNIAKLLLGFAGPLAQLEADVSAVTHEIAPGVATQLLADYEAVLGPDPCSCGPIELSLTDRQARAQRRWTDTADNTIAGLVRTAAALGLSITIDEPEPAICGVDVCGGAIASVETDRFVWVVNLQSDLTDAALSDHAAICGIATAGVTRCQDILPTEVDENIALLSCQMRRLSPADTHFVIQPIAQKTADLSRFVLDIDTIN